MNFKFFTGFGKSFFSRSKAVFANPPKTNFMTKMVQKQISNLYLKTALPATVNGMALRNLTQILEKRESSLIEIERLLNSLLGNTIDQGTIVAQPNPLGITTGLIVKQCTSRSK